MENAYNKILAQQRQGLNQSVLQIIAILLVITASFYYAGLFDISRLSEAIPSLFGLIGDMLPPDFSEAKTWFKPLLDTVAMSVAGTALAITFSLPLGFLAARNSTPHPLVYQIARGLLNALRSMPELILGIIFVAAVGFGALPGVLALGLHSIGMIGKFFAEAIEHADKAPIEAARAAGATPFQVVVHGILPQVLPQMVDVSLYRWEYNFRASTVMGMVGAGGIGFELMSSLRIMQYRDVSAILLVIFVMVTLADGLSAHLRKRFK